MSWDPFCGLKITRRETLCFGKPSDVGWSAARSRSSRLLTAKARHVAHVLGEPFDSSQIGRATLQSGSRRGSWKTEGAAEAESSLTGTVGCCCCQSSRWTVGVSVLVRTVSYGKKKRRSQMLMLLIQAHPHQLPFSALVYWYTPMQQAVVVWLLVKHVMQ